MPSRRPVPGPSHAGFGLLQMLVATLVLAVLYSLALPSFRHVLDTLHADSLRMQLVSVFATARSTAITRRQRIEACPSSDGQTCGEDWSHGWLLYPTARDPHPDLPGSPGMELLQVRQLARSRVHASPSAGRPRIRFRPDGRNAGLNQTIRICVEGRQLGTVTVNVPGRTRSARARRPTRCDAP